MKQRKNKSMAIKGKIQQLVNCTIPYKIILILLVIGICALLFPLLLIGKYNIPSADDYSYGIVTHKAIENGGSIISVLEAAWDQMFLAYQRTQGTFSAVFLFGLQPAIFGEDYYLLVPYIMLSVLIAGLYLFSKAFFGLFLQRKSAKNLYSAVIFCVIVILCTQFLPSPVQGFYWYNGAIYYTFFFGLSLILYSMLIKLAFKEAHEKMIILQAGIILLCVLIAFCNLITTLTTLIILVSAIILMLFCKNKNWKFFILPLIVYAACFYINVKAPGFSARQNLFDQRPGVFGTILLSFQYTITQLYRWNTIPVIALYIFLIPVVWRIASKSDFSFRMPWLVTLYSFCLQAAMNAPTYYAYADPGPGRVEDIRFFAMTILIINIFYWEGWFSKKFVQKSDSTADGIRLSFIFGVICLFAAGLFLSEKEQPITSISAFQSYRSGEAGLYKHIFKQRLEVLKDPEIKDALLREFPKKPYVIYFDDITYDPEDWRNLSMSQYYHKDSVRLMTHEEFEASLENK